MVVSSYFHKLRSKTFSEIVKGLCYRWCSLYYAACYAVFRLFPIDSKLILFESERDFCDNSWALYNYLLQEYPEYHFVWLCYERSTMEKQKGQLRTTFVHFDGSFHSYSTWYIARARYVFFTHGLLNAKRRRGQFVLNLWHGVALKGLKQKRAVQDSPFYNNLLCLGELNIATQATFLSCSEKLVLPLGYPRNDLLLNNIADGYTNPFVPDGFRGKVILWMPTFRASINPALSEEGVDTPTGLPLLATVTDLLDFNSYLHSINVCVVVKIHHLEAEKDAFKLSFSNIVFITDDDVANRNLQLYQIVGKSDALLSDYSSIAIDYLLVHKPMGFILDDIDSYAASRGAFLFEDVKSALAGSHIYTRQELKDFCLEIAQDIDSSKHLRDQLIDLMIKYQDNKSCERIAQFCKL